MKNPVSFGGISRNQGNDEMHQNHYEIVMFRQWNVVPCQIQLRQQFSWSNASVCWNMSWITLNPLTRNLLAGGAKMFILCGNTHTKLPRGQCCYLMLNSLLALTFELLTKRSKEILAFLYCGFQCSYMLTDI